MNRDDTSLTNKMIQGIHYSVSGNGSNTVVLLRGLGRWSEHWLGFESLLASKGLRVITIDNRGFGESKDVKIDRHSRMDEFADDVALIISKEAPSGAHVIGVSLGGMIALSLAAMKPQLVKSLVIVNSSVAGADVNRISTRAILAIISVIIGSKKGYERLAGILLGATSSAEKKSKMASAWAAIDSRKRPLFGHVWAQLMAARSFHGLVEMASVRCPVIVIKSEGDLFVDPANSDFIHGTLKGSTMIKHPTAGHELAFDDPEWFADIIVNVAK